MDRRVVYGSRDFTERLTKEYKVEAIKKSKGRPKKGGEGDK